MVYFTCNHCGEALKKQAVEKHSFKCSRNIFVSCIDCQKDFKVWKKKARLEGFFFIKKDFSFQGKEFDTHIKCISELEKYSGKDYVPKANLNKGAKKQEAWLEVVRNIQASKRNISQSVNSILSTISKHDNIPRKRTPFIRFLQNSFRYMKMSDIEAAWGLLEEEILKARATNGSSTTNGHAQNGTKRKAEERDEEPTAKKAKSDETETTFDWSETIKDIILSKNNQIKVNKLKKKVFNKYKNFYNVSAITDKFEKKFTKRMHKLGLIVEDDTVRLIE